MTDKERDSSDRRVLWIVAGGVTAAAAAIALLAGMSAQYGEQKERVTRARVAPVIREAAPAPRAMLASEARTPVTESRPTPPAILRSTPQQSPGSQVTIDPEADPMREGLAAFAEKNYELAAAYFEAEVAARPARAYSHYIHGLSLWKSGSAQQAEAALVRSTELNAGSVRSWVNLARVRNELGSPDGALEAARTAVELDDASASAHFLLARSLYNSGDPQAALAELELSLSFDPESGYAHNLAGLIQLEDGRTTEAEASFARAAGILPGVAYVQNNLGMALELSGRTEQALIAYQRAVDADPQHVKAAANLARLGPDQPVEETQADEEQVFLAATDPLEEAANGAGVQ